MKIAVLGAGSMGSLFGGLLSKAAAETWLIDLRADHIQAVNERGLIIGSEAGEQIVRPSATTDLREVGVADLLIVFVKATDTAAAIAEAQPLIGPKTFVLSLQNGLGNLESIARTVGPERVVAGVTYEGARMVAPGHVFHQVRASTVIGPFQAGMTDGLEEVVGLFRRAGLLIEVNEDVMSLVWSKAVINISVNALTALTGLRFSEILDCAEATAIVERSIDECVEVTRALGVTLAYEADPKGRIKEHLRRIGNNKSSMLQDFENGRKSEIEALNGTLVEYGRQVDVRTPCNELLSGLVKAIEWERGLRSSAARA